MGYFFLQTSTKHPEAEKSCEPVGNSFQACGFSFELLCDISNLSISPDSEIVSKILNQLILTPQNLLPIFYFNYDAILKTLNRGFPDVEVPYFSFAELSSQQFEVFIGKSKLEVAPSDTFGEIVSRTDRQHTKYDIFIFSFGFQRFFDYPFDSSIPATDNYVYRIRNLTLFLSLLECLAPLLLIVKIINEKRGRQAGIGGDFYLFDMRLNERIPHTAATA